MPLRHGKHLLARPAYLPVGPYRKVVDYAQEPHRACPYPGLHQFACVCLALVSGHIVFGRHDKGTRHSFQVANGHVLRKRQSRARLWCQCLEKLRHQLFRPPGALGEGLVRPNPLNAAIANERKDWLAYAIIVGFCPGVDGRPSHAYQFALRVGSNRSIGSLFP